jgi:hypothetical protein
MQTARASIDRFDQRVSCTAARTCASRRTRCSAALRSGARVAEAIVWRDQPQRMQLQHAVRADGERHAAAAAVGGARRSPATSLAARMIAGMQDYWMQMVLSLPIKSFGFTVAQMQLAFSVAGAQQSRRSSGSRSGACLRASTTLTQSPALDDA